MSFLKNVSEGAGGFLGLAAGGVIGAVGYGIDRLSGMSHESASSAYESLAIDMAEGTAEIFKEVGPPIISGALAFFGGAAAKSLSNGGKS